MANCSSCGAEINWATTEDNQRIPLDTKAENRFVHIGSMAEGRVRLMTGYTTHFVTCPFAARHRKRGKSNV